VVLGGRKAYTRLPLNRILDKKNNKKEREGRKNKKGGGLGSFPWKRGSKDSHPNSRTRESPSRRLEDYKGEGSSLGGSKERGKGESTFCRPCP